MLIGCVCEGKIQCVVAPDKQITIPGLTDTQVLAVKYALKPILFEVWVKFTL